MTIISPLPFTLVNGALADATQVMADFNEIVTDVNANAAHNGANSDITSLSGLTTPLSASQGGTGSSAQLVVTPQGRLSLTSATPVLTSDVTAATTVYWTLYIGNMYPWFNGTVWVLRATTELSLALDSNAAHGGYQQSGKNFDLFLFYDAVGGVDRLVTGPAWSSDTSRGSGAGTTELVYLNGFLVNKVQMTTKFDASASNLTVPVNRGLYVGTMRATANGQTAMIMNPAAASGGTPAVLGVWNYYNRVNIQATVVDSGAGYAYTGGVRQARNSAGNQVSFISGYAVDACSSIYQERITTGAATSGFFGIGFDDTTAYYHNSQYFISSLGGVANLGISSASVFISPQIGWHVVSANENSAGGATYDADSNATLSFQARM